MTARDHALMNTVPLIECQICHTGYRLARHHIVNRSITQCDDPENLIVLCPVHHEAVHNKSLDLGQYLTRSQAAKAVLLLGTLSRAYEFLYPSANPKSLLSSKGSTDG